MPFTAWKERNRQRDRKKYVMISGGFVIPALHYNSLNDSTQHFLEPTQILFKRPYLELDWQGFPESSERCIKSLHHGSKLGLGSRPIVNPICFDASLEYKKQK